MSQCLLHQVSSAGDVFKCAVGITTEYPIAELIISIGFLLILLIDKVAEEVHTTPGSGAVSHRWGPGAVLLSWVQVGGPGRGSR